MRFQFFFHPGFSNADILVDRKIKERKSKDDSKDSVDLSDVEKNSSDSLPNEMIGIMGDASMHIVPALRDFEIASIEIAPNTALPGHLMLMEMNGDHSTSADGNSDGEISVCVVCDKRFKSKPCLNKHMRSVHTVKVLASAKRSASITNPTKPASSKRSQSSDSQSGITHVGLPVNPITAKALASKLNERNNFLNNRTAKTNGSATKASSTVAAKPIPPLICIQSSSNQPHSAEPSTDDRPSNGSVNKRKRSAAENGNADTSDDEETNSVSNASAIG